MGISKLNIGNIIYKDLSDIEKNIAESSLKAELIILDNNHKLRKLFYETWELYKDGKFSYNGPTFSKPYNKVTLFEVAAMIHDRRNSEGYIGKAIDNEMFDIMITLNYPLKLILQRWFLTRLTPLNILRHKIKGTYISNKVDNLYSITHTQAHI